MDCGAAEDCFETVDGVSREQIERSAGRLRGIALKNGTADEAFSGLLQRRTTFSQENFAGPPNIYCNRDRDGFYIVAFAIYLQLSSDPARNVEAAIQPLWTHVLLGRLALALTRRNRGYIKRLGPIRFRFLCPNRYASGETVEIFCGALLALAIEGRDSVNWH